MATKFPTSRPYLGLESTGIIVSRPLPNTPSTRRLFAHRSLPGACYMWYPLADLSLGHDHCPGGVYFSTCEVNRERVRLTLPRSAFFRS